MWVEFKRGGETDDPFSDDEDSPFEINTDYKGKIRGQLIAYAEATINQQQRTHLYSVLVMHRFTRLIRWDHSGTIVTDKFDIKKNPEILGEFFWQFAHATDEVRGFDPTAQLLKPTTEIYQLMDEKAEEELPYPFDYIRELFKQSLDGNVPRYKLSVEDEKKGTCYFLVGKPRHVTPGLVGHGARSYVALDVQDKMFVHLKDMWRYDSNLLDEDKKMQCDEDQDQVEYGHSLRANAPHSEGETLTYLNRCKVQNVPHSGLSQRCGYADHAGCLEGYCVAWPSKCLY
ncbi:hypothetical protein A0H81_01932 [Grifola frondosa]|uniref:Fungal-type protein kinase domain-containing protein n=1 Tax=Grifola frondosa TaxID=5627 RepID=A0A1C7ML26_GRIFR|nr:hypothetical protein A0H81_01932 [Grifola frondosa]